MTLSYYLSKSRILEIEMRAAQIIVGFITSFITGSWGLITGTALTSSNKEVGGIVLYASIGLFLLSAVLIFTDAVQPFQKWVLLGLIVPFAALIVYVGFGGDESKFWSFLLS
jgi:hypothetical protein